MTSKQVHEQMRRLGYVVHHSRPLVTEAEVAGIVVYAIKIVVDRPFADYDLLLSIDLPWEEGARFIPSWVVVLDRAVPREGPRLCASLRARAMARGAVDPAFAAAIETVYALGPDDEGLRAVAVGRFVESAFL